LTHSFNVFKFRLGLAQLEESEQEIEKAREIYRESLTNYEHSRRIPKVTSSSPSVVGHKKRIKPAKSGDKWINVYKSWTKLEEQYGNYNSANNVYSRAAVAFPNEWKVFLRWAKFQVRHGRSDRARTLFELACDSAGSRNAEPYRDYAEYEMNAGNYERARSILFLGAQSLSESSDGTRHNDEFARLYHSWAVCEWHLGNLDRAEILFDNSLRLIESGKEGSANRSLVLYSIARFLFYARNDSIVAQHCVCLSISESLSPSGDAGVWRLWAKIAESMSNTDLKKHCLLEAAKLESMPNDITSLRLVDLGIDQMLRKSPWQQKIQKPASSMKKSWYTGISFPHLSVPSSM
jgi:tetratricopeptide (TPR) repeat protein